MKQFLSEAILKIYMVLNLAPLPKMSFTAGSSTPSPLLSLVPMKSLFPSFGIPIRNYFTEVLKISIFLIWKSLLIPVF